MKNNTAIPVLVFTDLSLFSFLLFQSVSLFSDV